MLCEICHRPASARLPFHCILCARDAVYNQRIQLAHILLERERLNKEVEELTANTLTPNNFIIPRSSKPIEPSTNPSWSVQRAAADQALSEEKTESILHRNQVLREEIKKANDGIAERKARFHRRRVEFTSAKQELLQIQANGVEALDKSIWRTQKRWDMMHSKTAQSRIFLSREAALLYGLQLRKRQKGGLGRDAHYIGGVPIPDLRDLNNASPGQVTTSATNLAHLVHLVSHYFSLRLPAEITLPHCDYPFATIFSPSSSYSGRDVPFPGSTPSHSSNYSPSASRHAEQRSLPRPRPLHLSKQLSALAKDDQIAYASFVEGMTFLAWDITWLCKTQGMTVGDNSWDEVCAMGKNLWQLLLAPLARPSMSRESSGKSSPQKPAVLESPTIKTQAAPKEPFKGATPPGHFSHGTAYGLLSAAAGNEHMRSWRLQSPIKVIEKVKAMLLAERTGAEWEILEGNEWEVEDNEAETNGEPDLVIRFPIEETGVLVKPEANEGHEEETAEDSRKDEEEGRGKSTSGWMKLKNRQS